MQSKLAAIFLLIILAVAFGAALMRRGAQYRTTLNNGFTLTLKQVTFTSSNFNYSHSGRGRLWRLVEPVLPAAIRQRFPSNTGSFGFGSDGATNLFLITDLIRAPS